MNKHRLIREKLNENKFVKIIAGINNFDTEKVKNVVLAADKGNADAVDVAAREDIIRLAKELTDLPVFVSATEPKKLAMAAQLGAEVLEIGNFDALYADGLRITAQEVLSITKETLNLVKDYDVMISVTVPGHIDISEQIELAQQLEELGIDLIQTEGAAIANVESLDARGLLEKAQVSIANTIELVRNINIPIMTASGISTTSAPLAIAAGANGIGVGSSVNKLNSSLEMIITVKSIVESIKNIRRNSEEKVSV